MGRSQEGLGTVPSWGGDIMLLRLVGIGGCLGDMGEIEKGASEWAEGEGVVGVSDSANGPW